MRNYAIGLSVLALACSTLAQPQATGNKVGVINIQTAIITTKDGQKAAAELEAKSAPRRKTLEGKQADINSMKDQLQKGQNALSETAKNELVRNIDVKTKSFTRDMEDAQAEFEQEQQKLLQELGGRIVAVIEKYSRDNGYVLVLDVSSPQTPVLVASPTIDITKDIIELYDKNSPGAGAAAKPSAPPPAAVKPPAPPVTKPAVPPAGAPKPPVK